MRTTIAVQGAREHNLQNVSLEIPRDKLIVVTGVSGSGKSSLAFDTIYAEGQRRYMESLSSYARRFVEQLRKPDVDFMFGLSPVISIEQKTVGRNPRSTVGTMTDISGYLNLLFTTSGEARCPWSDEAVPIRSKAQIVESIMALPSGTSVELRAPVFPIYGENLEFLFTEIRKRGCRHLIIDGECFDLSEDVAVDENAAHRMEAVVDHFVVRPGIEKQLATGVESALDIGERFLKVHIAEARGKASSGKTTNGKAAKGWAAWGSKTHNLVVGDLASEHFMFNEPKSACRTCLGLGMYKQVHPTLLIPDAGRSIAEGAFVPAAFKYNPDTWDGKMMWSLSQQHGFSVETPWRELPQHVVDLLLHGTGGGKFVMQQPPGTKTPNKYTGQEHRFEGIIARIERSYRRYRQEQQSHSRMEAYLNKVMVEYCCPDCHGARLRPQRLQVTLGGQNIHQLGETNFSELKTWLDGFAPVRAGEAGRQVLREIVTRLELLLGIGLDYLNFNRRSATLSGGEAQRIRLSTQIGSGLMGMLYVLDEPSIGLHPKDNMKMIQTLRRLRDLGNTVIVVEHDEDTIRAADHVVEMGPGPGVHGGQLVAQGTVTDLLAHPISPTGHYLSGRKNIAVPPATRAGNGHRLRIKGARENNLRDLDVEFPLGQFICVTGASGSGKSTLVNDILFKKLYAHFYDSRVLSGEHDALEGVEHVSDVIAIDQSPIGRSPRSNPATYIGFYDSIRKLFSETPESLARGYTPSRFSFNVKGGRCEECAGEGTVTTHLAFMPDVEVLCESCKGARYNTETLEVTFNGRNIAEVLALSVEEGVEFFKSIPAVAHKIAVLHNLGLGYLTLGQSATTLSGGEAQRIKLAFELSKMKRGDHIIYILDEPTTGLHLADIQRLLECLNRLVNAGHTVLVIEHHLDVIKTADHIIDLGPEGGHNGGLVIAQGTPRQVASTSGSHTGQFLKTVLNYSGHPIKPARRR